MNEIDIALPELLSAGKLTFLAGAGCSVEAPSCLPAGNAMMRAIVEFACPAAEVEKILALEQLRFEALVEIFRDVIDEELHLLDYFGLCGPPNQQHLFLADMLGQGHFVVSTLLSADEKC